MTKTKLPLKQAQSLTDKIIAALTPGCIRSEAAGSVRRLRPEVGDIEIVCIPRQTVDLFGNPVGSLLDMVLANLVNEGRLIRGDKNGVKYKNFLIPTGPNFGPSLPDLKLDLFITSLECWGVNFTIRTGPAEFSHRLVTQKSKGGLLPSDLSVSGARVWRGAEALDTPEESDIFRLIELDWIEPRDRN